MPTYEQESNAGGLDRRYGMYARKDASAFWDLDNVYIDVGGQVARRAPLRKPGGFDALSFGLFPVNGALTTLAAKGTAPSLPAGVSALYFDVPYGATAHDVKDVVNLGDTIIALIAHTISGSVRYFLHVFDNAPDLLTYVTDPAFPWMHEMDPAVTPVMTAAASKVWISDKAGDVYHSAVNKPRVWNTFTRDQFLAQGHEVHLSCPASGLLTFIIPLDAAQIGSFTAGYAAWIVEKYTGTGTAAADFATNGNWTAITEVASSPAAGQCAFSTTPNSTTGATYTNWIRVAINAAAAGWYRVRIFPPQTTSQPALNYVRSGAITPDIVNYGSVIASQRGDGVAKVFDLPASDFVWLGASPSGMEVTKDGSLMAGGTFSVASTADNAPRVIFSSVPAAGTLLQFLQLINTSISGTEYWVAPPGEISTPFGVKKWGGGKAVAPYTVLGAHPSSPETYYLLINLDASGNPTGLELRKVSTIFGKMLYENVVLMRIDYNTSGTATPYVPVYGGLSTYGPSIAPANTFLYRNGPTDLRLNAAVGALFGFADAGFLPTSKDDLSGGPVTLLASARNRLLVMYARGSLLWTIFTDPSKDVLADTGAIGTDGQNTPHGVDFFGAQIVPTARGLRLADLGLRLTDVLDDENLGSPVDGLGFPQFLAGTFWPFLSHYVAAVTIGGTFCFLVLSYHKQERISAWSRFPAPVGVSTVDARSMVALGSKLYFRSDTALYYFDGAVCEALKTSGLQPVGTFKDDNDSSNATAYSSVAEPLLNKIGKPRVMKRYRQFGLSQTGKSKTTFKRISGASAVYQDGPTIDGDNFARARVRLAMRAEAIAPRMVSNDTRGWRVEFFNYEFDYLGKP